VANKILQFFEALVKPTITLASLANAAGRIGAAVDNTSLRAERGIVFVQIKTGATGPTAGRQYRIYLVRRSNDSGGGSNDISDDGLGTTDAAVSTEPTMAECIGAITLTTAANTTYRKSFPVRDLSAVFSIVVWNDSAQTVSTTAGDHDLQVLLINPEIQ